MTQFLPPNLLALFAPRDAIPYLPPAAKLPHEKVGPNYRSYSGVSQFMADFEDPKETPPPTRSETKEEKKKRIAREKAEATLYKLEQDLALWDPHSGGNITEDAFKTLFVARINYDTSESKLRREFEVYGPIKQIKLTNTNDAKPRGYAFIEYEHERDMHSAYKHADGKKIDGRRVLVDVERARTVKGWRPRRLGGGLGTTRRNKAEEAEPEGTAERSRGERSKSRERRKRSRSKERRRSRSRERRRSRERDRERDAGVPGGPERRRSRSRERKRRRSRSRERRRDDDRDRKRRRSRSREKRDRGDRDEVKVKTEKPDDGYPNLADAGNGHGAPQLAVGQTEELAEYPAAETNGDAM